MTEALYYFTPRVLPFSVSIRSRHIPRNDERKNYSSWYYHPSHPRYRHLRSPLWKPCFFAGSRSLSGRIFPRVWISPRESLWVHIQKIRMTPREEFLLLWCYPSTSATTHSNHPDYDIASFCDGIFPRVCELLSRIPLATRHRCK